METCVELYILQVRGRINLKCHFHQHLISTLFAMLKFKKVCLIVTFKHHLPTEPIITDYPVPSYLLIELGKETVTSESETSEL